MVVILQDIRSLYNVGSIFRTSDAAGVEKLYLSGITPEPIDRFGRIRPQLAKVSLGAEKSLPWEKVKNPNYLIDKLKKQGYKILAVEQSKRAIPYYKWKPFDRAQGKDKSKTALIFGNEVRGLSPAILKKADKILEIPMYGKKESLNVSVAAGIILFHVIIK